MTPRELHAALGKLIKENPRAKLRWADHQDNDLCTVVDVTIRPLEHKQLRSRIVLETVYDT